MRDHDEVERAPDDQTLALSRRAMLRLGLLPLHSLYSTWRR
jgi:hypothetical protein